MRGFDHSTHQMGCCQPDKGDQAGLRHRCARGQGQNRHQGRAHGRQGQAQAFGRGLAQAQTVQRAAQAPSHSATHQPDSGHQHTRRPADETGAAQGERLHGLQDFGRGQRDQIFHRAQHHPNDDPSQQQAQRVLDALRQHQRERNAADRACESGARQTDAHQPLRGEDGRHRRAAQQHQGDGHAERRAGRAAKQKRVGQRIAEKPLRDGPSQPQQGAGAPRPQGARQADVPHDLPGGRVAQCLQNAIKPRATYAYTQKAQGQSEQQQAPTPKRR